MMRLAILALLLAGCCGLGRIELPAAPPAPPAPPANVSISQNTPAAVVTHTPPSTGNRVADGISDARPVDVVSWLLPWLAGLLTLATVGLVIAAAWLRSRSLATLAAGCAVGLALVLILKMVLWILAGLAGLALLGGLAYLLRELWMHRRELAQRDPLHHLLTRKKTP